MSEYVVKSRGRMAELNAPALDIRSKVAEPVRFPAPPYPGLCRLLPVITDASSSNCRLDASIGASLRHFHQAHLTGYEPYGY